MSRRKLQKNKSKILNNKNKIILIVIIIVLIIISIVKIFKTDNIEEASLQESKEVEEVQNEKMVNKLVDMNERNRMEYYLAIFMNYIEDKQYEKAYDLLYDEFKEKYFPTLSDFQKYAEETFPDMMNIEHSNIERNGEIYVLWIYISDLINGGPDDKKEMNVVIKENDLNDFVLSFSVI